MKRTRPVANGSSPVYNAAKSYTLNDRTSPTPNRLFLAAVVESRMETKKHSPSKKLQFSGSINDSISLDDDCVLIHDNINQLNYVKSNGSTKASPWLTTSADCVTEQYNPKSIDGATFTSSRPRNSSLVECPLCFEFMDSVLVMSHASTCEGKTSGSVNQLKSQNNSSLNNANDKNANYANRINAKRDASTKNETKRGGGANGSCFDDIDSTNKYNTQTTQQCPICREHVDKYKIGVHVVLCDGVNATMSDDDDDDLPPALCNDADSVVASSKEHPRNVQEISSSDTTSSTVMTTCPVCSMVVEISSIDVHVNMCLDRMSSV